jgi:hypothetical protein
VSQRREMRRLGADYEMERLRQQGANYRANVDCRGPVDPSVAGRHVMCWWEIDWDDDEYEDFIGDG